MLPALMKKKILIVEDEEPLRFLYEEELKEEGYEVLTAVGIELRRAQT